MIKSFRSPEAEALFNDLLVVRFRTVERPARPLERAQAALVDAMLSTGVPAVTAALRTPYDLAMYPRAETHLCTYSLLPEPLEALAGALFGELPCPGILPVSFERIGTVLR